MFNYSLDDRIVQIINISRKKQHSSIDYLASTLGVSTRSIRNDIKQLNSELNGIAVFVNEKGKGFYLKVEDEKEFASLMENIEAESKSYDSPTGRIAYIFDRLLNQEETLPMDDLAYEMNIGRSTLVNELKKAKVSLEAYNLSIVGKQSHGIFLDGKEINLRFFILDNIYDFLYDDFPLDEDVKNEIVTISNEHDIESTTQKALLQFIIVMLDRLLKNHPLIEVNNKHEELINSNDYKIAKNIAEMIEAKLPIKIPEYEILFITIPIAGRRTPTNNRTMADIIIPEDVTQLLNNIVEQLGFNKQVIQENETIFKDFQYHLTFMINRLIYGLRLKNPLLDDVKEKYPLAFKLAELAGDVIEREYDVKVSEHELGYIAFYFGVFIAKSEGEVKKINKAAVICGTGRGTAKLVSIQLERVLKQNTDIDIYSDVDVSKELLNDYDIIFSTVKLEVKTETPTVMINEIFDERSVAKKIEEVMYVHHLPLDNGIHASFMKQLVDQDKFFLLNSEKSYNENVHDMVHALIDKGYFDSGFHKRLNERAKKGSMVFENYIAFPHTYNTLSDKIELAIGVFPTAVTAENKKVRLVFLLGVPEQESVNTEHLLVKIYDEIIRIANDQSLLSKLTKSTGYEDFIEHYEKNND
ncbi:BglG family transcription antiterminator [Bacillus shivajii]|uniref:BglG family transcription antiterminator n=1 Tax=Bacillus shivajii TaxID=1983719 RepID=UPI001CF9EC45|nr:BglG family transcription antiterminator [Bacillus shivajii]UCZ54964.1 BglG family transcription antiterminator [Bacillus shivajii]